MPNKKNISSVETLSEKLSRAQSIYFTNYLGLNVSDVTSLRKKFYENGVEYLVVKNTLLKIASSINKIELGEELFSGSTAIALSYDEPVKAAKIIKEFLKDHELLVPFSSLFLGLVLHIYGLYQYTVVRIIRLRFLSCVKIMNAVLFFFQPSIETKLNQNKGVSMLLGMK